MSKLSNIVRVVKPRKRVGRGGARGGTSGRGHKGQKARSGHRKLRPLFEGGQMPLFRRLPKRGFSNKQFAQLYEIVSIGNLERVFDSGTEINRDLLIERGLIRGTRGALVKVLGSGTLQKPLIVYADAFSASAAQMIERQNGKALVVAKEK
jgi:large subunit ribosomal protein L15